MAVQRFGTKQRLGAGGRKSLLSGSFGFIRANIINHYLYPLCGQDLGYAEPHALPAALEVELFTAHTEQISDDAGNIRFFPDGSSTGGEIVLGDGRSKFHVQVDWLTGRVSILDAAAQ